MDNKDLHDFIVSQETQFRLPIDINDRWKWSFYEHVTLSFLYLNSQLWNGKDEFTFVKNITRPILNLQHRATGFDVKDVLHYVDNADQYYKSFLVNKFYDRWARENGIDTVIDEMVESYCDYGGALLKNVNDVKPEVVPLQSIAFCDQTDILSGPIGIKHFFSPDQLMDMASVGWGDLANGADTDLETAIELSRDEKKNTQDNTTAKTPGKYIEVYEVHGVMPERFMDKLTTSKKYSRQMFIGCFYTKKDGKKAFITLYHKPESKSPFKFIKRDPVHGRALGFGGVEELFDAQMGVNYDQKRIQDMLDAASKTILKATGPNSSTIASRNRLKEMENMEIIDVGDMSDLGQVDTYPRNMKLFETSVQAWEAHAQQMGSANDSIMGEAPNAGTPFKLQELVTQESHSLHDYRKGKLATFWEEVEREWVIPHLAREIGKGQEFMAELDIDELKEITDAIAERASFDHSIDKLFAFEAITEEEKQAYEDKVRQEFRKKGAKHFIKILKGEMKDAPLTVKVNVAGKQKQMAAVVDRITNIFRFAFSNPQGFTQVMQIPGMASGFNQILEYSGLSPIDFAGIDEISDKIAQQNQPPQPPQEGQPVNSGIIPSPQNAAMQNA